MNTEIKLVTPEMAMELLKRNINNRRLSERTVGYYAEQMRNNEWRLTGQGISISENGVILDGQHRLEAVVRAKTPVKFLIIYGVKDDTFANYDVGKNRSFGDVFDIQGIPYSSLVSSIIVSYHRRILGITHRPDHKKQLSKKNALTLYYKNAELFKEIAKNSTRIYSYSRLLRAAYMGGFMAYLIIEKKHSPEKVYSFFDQILSGRNIENNTILLLRDNLIKDGTGRYKMSPKMKDALIIITWNRYVKGVEINRLRYSTEKEIEEII